MRLNGLAMLICGALGAFAAAPARAHPHVWISGREAVVFNDRGEIVALRHRWLFDDMYSAFVIEGAAKKKGRLTKEELAPLAKSNVEDLAEFDYFTHAKVSGRKLAFGAPQDYALEEVENKRVELSFTMPLDTPVSPKIFSFQVYDPTYFVAFELAPGASVELVNAPHGCSSNVSGAKPLAAAESKKLTESFFSGLSPGADFGVKLAAAVVVACP
ncbi:DUF1007 family protein [Methylocella sp.]|uniref:DUF1007 family protein n=1 Tax=Methylocella sp. TaxID=1978226 RepID=UPI0037838AF4